MHAALIHGWSMILCFLSSLMRSCSIGGPELALSCIGDLASAGVRACKGNCERSTLVLISSFQSYNIPLPGQQLAAYF